VITISTLAAEKLKDILVEQGEEGASLRVILMPGANGGAQYMLALEQDAKEDDTVISTEGVSILIDPESAPLMQGAEIDYMDGLMRSGFVINNPNIQSSGCGEEGCACGGGGCACGGH
jgi:iron-sulfur cluster assembly accessory protein